MSSLTVHRRGFLQAAKGRKAEDAAQHSGRITPGRWAQKRRSWVPRSLRARSRLRMPGTDTYSPAARRITR